MGQRTGTGRRHAGAGSGPPLVARAGVAAHNEDGPTLRTIGKKGGIPPKVLMGGARDGVMPCVHEAANRTPADWLGSLAA